MIRGLGLMPLLVSICFPLRVDRTILTQSIRVISWVVQLLGMEIVCPVRWFDA